MKAIHLLPGILILTVLPGCSLFKKTSKTGIKDTYSLNRSVEVNLLNLKTAGRETQIYSYWTDSTFYKYELIKEQIDEAKLAQEKTNEKQSAEHQQTVKERKPIIGWVYAIIALFILGSYLIYRRFLA